MKTIKIKRYVKEIANEFLRNPAFPSREKGRINRIITCCEKGACSSMEAVSVIMSIANSVDSMEGGY